MIRIKVDGKEIDVPEHFTLLQAAESAGAEVPRFCFHERLSVAGNCRMCLVEVKGGPPKPQASCALGVKDLRVGPNGELPEILTSSDMVKKGRAGVLEFLLINHPLDCPICDQGGECDLQDQAMAYGHTVSRYNESKRAVEEKYLGPLIKTAMTRCIHCTRCVRFITEVAGVSELGLTGRGEDAEIASYLESSLTSEMQGNIIDLCPVGALTSKPYEFKARPWELHKVETIDVMDALGSAIRVDIRGNAVLRILPRINDQINEEWISDKTRFVVDGLRSNRIDQPYVKGADGKFIAVSWGEALDKITQELQKTIKAGKANSVGALAGPLSGVEEMFALKELLASFGAHNVDCRQNNSTMHPIYGRGSYLFNSTIEGIDSADAILLIGTNPRIESAVLNSRILKRQRNAKIPIGFIGKQADLSYPYEFLGNGSQSIMDLLNRKSYFLDKLQKAKRPLIILGQAALSVDSGLEILRATLKLSELVGALTPEWNGFSVLQTEASAVGGLDIGFVPPVNITSQNIVCDSEILFLLGVDDLDLSQTSAFTIYIGTHGDKGANQADVILPASTYLEKSAIFVNMEGRPQLTSKVLFAPGEAKEDWSIIRALSESLNMKLPFDSLPQLRARLYNNYPHLANTNELTDTDINHLLEQAMEFKSLEEVNFLSTIHDFYLTNAIARSSKTLSECSAFFSAQKASSVKSPAKQRMG